ncbi:integrase catalytic domain-containing protein [Trichonephila clavipes]|nr:integrase catalytic domain-containing protein [Trichonephila clavipes]
MERQSRISSLAHKWYPMEAHGNAISTWTMLFSFVHGGGRADDLFQKTTPLVETRSISERQILERWSTEYLTHLQTRAKWSEQNPQPDGESARSFKGSQHQALDWPMGRILEVFPGSDGLVRVVNVKTSTGILKRAITKVVPLHIPVDPATVGKNIEHFTIS